MFSVNFRHTWYLVQEDSKYLYAFVLSPDLKGEMQRWSYQKQINHKKKIKPNKKKNLEMRAYGALTPGIKLSSCTCLKYKRQRRKTVKKPQKWWWAAPFKPIKSPV